MQELWAKILAGECNNTGSFSKMTLSVVGELDKNDAILFSSLCSCVFKMNGKIHPIIFEANDIEYQRLGGLISFNSITGYVRQGFEKRAILEYFDSKILLEFPKENKNEFQMGNVLFSKAGEQLYSICELHKNIAILEKTLTFYEHNYNIKYALL